MISVSKSVPSRTVIGTTFFGSISGCRARISSTEAFVRSSGCMAFILCDSFARAKTASSVTSISMLCKMLSRKDAHSAESSAKMRSISFFSCKASSRRALLAFTALIGSMKTVLPVEETSWIRPGTSFLHSALTGTT